MLFQKAVPFPLNFSRFQGMGSDVFWLTVNSIGQVFIDYDHSVLIFNVFVPGDYRIKPGFVPADCKEDKKELM